MKSNERRIELRVESRDRAQERKERCIRVERRENRVESLFCCFFARVTLCTKKV